MIICINNIAEHTELWTTRNQSDRKMTEMSVVIGQKSSSTKKPLACGRTWRRFGEKQRSCRALELCLRNAQCDAPEWEWKRLDGDLSEKVEHEDDQWPMTSRQGGSWKDTSPSSYLSLDHDWIRKPDRRRFAWIKKVPESNLCLHEKVFGQQWIPVRFWEWRRKNIFSVIRGEHTLRRMTEQYMCHSIRVRVILIYFPE